jgi:recombination protein RecT
MARTNVRDAAKAAPGSQVAVRDEAAGLLEPWMAAITAQLPAYIKPEYFLSTALSMMQSKNGAQLADCDRASLYVAIMECARHGLMPGTDEAAIVPFQPEDRRKRPVATFIPQYQGLIKQMLNSGQIAAVEARLIYQRDKWSLGYGDGRGFFHEPALVDPETGYDIDRGRPILAYCYAVYHDGSRTSVTTVTRSQAIEVRDTRSRGYAAAERSGRKNSVWHTDFDAKWVITAVRRAAKYIPKSAELAELLLAAARDDTDRPAGAEPPTPASMGWTATVDSVVSSTVVPDSPADDDDVPPPPPPPDPDPPDRPDRMAILRAVRAKMDAAGLDGPGNADLRLALLAVLIAGDQVPAPVKSPQSLTLTQAQQAAATLEGIERTAASQGKPPGEALRRIAEAAHGKLGGQQ